MANIVQISGLCPFQFVLKDKTLGAGFHLKHFDDFLSADRRYNFQEPRTYCNKLQNSDAPYFQIVSNYGPVTCRLIDVDGNTILDGVVTPVTTAFYTSPDVCYGITFDLSDVVKGCYQIELTVGVGLPQSVFVTNPIDIDEDWPNTILFNYTNSKNKAGAIFENGESFNIRIEGVLIDFQPGSNDFVFEDQTADLVNISSTPFRSWKLVVGNSEGVADWIADILNRAVGCDALQLDGKYFTKNEGAKFERNGDRDYPLSAWTIDIREKTANDGVTFTNDEESVDFTIFFGVQDNSDDPEDFSRYISQSPYSDITIPYGTVSEPKYFWMWHVLGPTQKTNYQDIGNPLNLGTIGGDTDLFEVRPLTVDGADGLLYITRYKTGFSGTNQLVKYYTINTNFNAPGNFVLSLIETNTPTGGEDRLTFTWDAASPLPDSYTLRVIDVTDSITTEYTGITSTTKTITVSNDLTDYKVSVKSVYSGGESNYTSEILYP